VATEATLRKQISKGTIVLYIEIVYDASRNIGKESLTGKTMQNVHPEEAGTEPGSQNW
jgi:hypothetical protein